MGFESKSEKVYGPVTAGGSQQVKTVTTAQASTHPIALDAAIDAKQAGADFEGQRLAAVNAYRASIGEPPLTELPAPQTQNEVIPEVLERTKAPVSTPVSAPKEVEAPPNNSLDDSRTDAMYRRWTLARVRNDARAVDFDALEQWEVDDVLALRGRRMDFTYWVSIRFPNE
jgi:hypothetical protein